MATSRYTGGADEITPRPRTLPFDLREIPALRGPLPPSVSDVRFTVDMSGLVPLAKEALIDRDPHFWDLVPDE